MNSIISFKRVILYDALFKKLNTLPNGLAKPLSKIPYGLRPIIGRHYNISSSTINEFNRITTEEKKAILFKKMETITNHAYENITFYKEFYRAHKFNPKAELNTFEDLQKIPIVSKKELLKYPLEQRSFLVSTKKILSNTGGTSGSPLSFYIPIKKVGIEWAHVHHIWYKQLGFNYRDVKLLLVGRSKVFNHIEFDYKRNSLRADIYAPYDKIFERLNNKFNNFKIKFIHGYPSAIYELAVFCNENIQAKDLILKHLKGIFLVSEFTPKSQRDFIENTFQVPSFSFYGHSEGCVIAYEDQPYHYTTMHSYGFTEAVNINNDYNLIGTNYYNFVSPLIRYNTEDIVSSLNYNNGLLNSFKLDQGRKGDFILDKNNKNIPLTGLIFGRHHQLFDYCSHIQVKQTKSGNAQILYVCHKPLDLPPEQLFDSTNVDMSFTFEEINKPIKTPNGKLKLLV